MVDMLAIIIERAENYGQIEVVPHLEGGGLSIHQYVDDTILFIKQDLQKKLKLILLALEQLSSLKINFSKIKLFCFTERPKMMFSSMFKLFWLCARFTNALGIQIHYRRLTNAE
jgi:hypothetical protein